MGSASKQRKKKKLSEEFLNFVKNLKHQIQIMATDNVIPDPLDRKCKLRTLNEMITCKICHGYLVDATTVTECLHTFCKSCIVKHLEDSNVCPECEDVIHQSHPLDYIAYDRTLQDLVYKIVPGLEKDEEKDAQEDEESNTPDANTNMDFHRFDEQVGLQLELKDDNDTKKNLALKRRFIRCSSLATVTHLRKFIAKKLLTNVDKHKDIEIFCNDEPLFKDHTLKFVYVTRWRTKDPPLVLKYCAKPFTEHED